MLFKPLSYIKRGVKAMLTESRPRLSLLPEGEVSGHILLSYITAPFLLEAGKPIPNTHSNFWEARQIARTFLELGYAVDVIDWDNQKFKLKHDYSFCIDLHNLERLVPQLGRNCVKILHTLGAHWLFQNRAEYARLLALQQRRGVTLKPRRTVPPSLGIEQADHVTTWGNKFTIDTYRYARKSIHRLPIPATSVYPWLVNKDYGACRNRFLWFGNVGMVHKGLDLVLEAFAQMPDHHLTVCGRISGEPDFEAAYFKELYQMDHIETVGWVDTDGEQFRKIVANCVGAVFPSCSEGGSGGVVTCMHAGLIPIISYESGVDVRDSGLVLKSSSVEEIVRSVRDISDLPARELEEKSRKAWDYARGYHTRGNYAKCYQDFVRDVLKVPAGR